MKFIRAIKKYPYLFLLIFNSLILTMIGYAGRNNIYSDYKIDHANTPQLALVFEGAGENRYPWSDWDNNRLEVLVEDSCNLKPYEKQISFKDDSNAGNTTKAIKSNGVTKELTDSKDEYNAIPHADSQGTEDNATKAEAAVKNDNDADHNMVTETETADSNQKGKPPKNNGKPTDTTADDKDSDASENNEQSIPISPMITDTPANEAELPDATEYEFQIVDKNYFDDALFIGDSRTVGLSEYSELNNSTYYADVGLTIYDIFDKKIANVDGTKETIIAALKKKEYKKIYIMLGINELGTGTTKTFTDEYNNVIYKIRELEPNAIIFIEGIMKVSKEKSDTDPIYNNVNIKERNDSIAQLADNKRVFYIDVNESLTDKQGNLPSKYTFDEVHLKAAYYKFWSDYLFSHGILVNNQ